MKRYFSLDSLKVHKEWLKGASYRINNVVAGFQKFLNSSLYTDYYYNNRD